jgi:hypothetical protein
MNKGELCAYVGKDWTADSRTAYDYALPQDWVDTARKVLPELATQYYVWLYEPGNIAGRPVHLAEGLVDMVSDGRAAVVSASTLHAVMAALYEIDQADRANPDAPTLEISRTAVLDCRAALAKLRGPTTLHG